MIAKQSGIVNMGSKVVSVPSNTPIATAAECLGAVLACSELLAFYVGQFGKSARPPDAPIVFVVNML